MTKHKPLIIIIIKRHTKQKHLIPYILIPNFHLNVMLPSTTWFTKTLRRQHQKIQLIKPRQFVEVCNIYPRFRLEDIDRDLP
jgi:hypothetical protein